MLIVASDKTCIGGPLDVIVLMRNVNDGRYYALFAEEAPMPGPVPEMKDTPVVRLRSKMHHTEGADTLEEGRKHVRELATQILLPAENVSDEPVDWDGQPFSVMVPNWRRQPGQRPTLRLGP